MAEGTAIAAQTVGDCKVVQCDGSGSTEVANDDLDLPNDGKFCTTDTCVGGVATFTPATSGTTCGTNLFCDTLGNCAGCTLASECSGTTDACQHPTCTTGVCETAFSAAGTLSGTQTAGDCKRSECNGIGGTHLVNDDTDVPVDGKQCTSDVCTAGVPSNPNTLPNSPCNQGTATKCDGHGQCVDCILNADCGTNTACATFTCNTGSCSEQSVSAGTVIGSQTTGDCKQNQCDGSGNIVPVPFPTDIPTDTNPCTDDVCTGSSPSNPPSMPGTVCPGGHCDGSGACVQCMVPADCGTATACKSFTCTAAGACQENDVATGIAAGTQTAGDCHQAQCDGLGNPLNAVDDTDPPSDGNDCTKDICTLGVASHPAEGIDTVCNQLGGHFCDALGNCVECNENPECTSLDCTAAHTCAAATCTDTIKNQDETDIDCGGLICGHCAQGGHCNGGADCTSGQCVGGICEDAPEVISTTPGDTQTGVSVATPISIVFGVPMDALTLTTKSTLDSLACSGNVQVSTDGFVTCIPLTGLIMSADLKTATWTPAPGLSYGETFKIRVTTGAQSVSAMALTSTFTTATGFTSGFAFPPTGTDGSVVVAEVYGGGGNSGSLYKNDFIVLHNRGTTSVNLNGFAVQYAGISSGTWAVTPLTGSIAGGDYFLIQESAGAGGTANLPTPDVTGAIAIGAAAGKVALTNNVTALTTVCPTDASIQSLVVFGTGGTCANPAAATTNTTSTQRLDSGCTLTGSNTTEFSSGAPNPRNSSTTADACVGVANETGVDGEADFCNVQSPLSLTVQTATASNTVFCQLFEAGHTEAAGPPTDFVMELGYGPRNKNPENEAGWTWTPMTYNVQVGNNDEFMGTFTPSVAAGDYAYACRAIHTSNAITYCDAGGAGSNVGLLYETPQEPDLTVTP